MFPPELASCWRRGRSISAKVRTALAALAQEVLAEDPFSGAVIVYRAKRSDRVKILVWDSQRPCADLEAIAAGIVPLAADHGRRDEALAGRVRGAV